MNNKKQLYKFDVLWGNPVGWELDSDKKTNVDYFYIKYERNQFIYDTKDGDHEFYAEDNRLLRVGDKFEADINDEQQLINLNIPISMNSFNETVEKHIPEKQNEIKTLHEFKRGDIVGAWNDHDKTQSKVIYTGGITIGGRYICELDFQSDKYPGVFTIVMYDHIDIWEEKYDLRQKIQEYIKSYDNNELSLDKTLHNIMNEINESKNK